MAPVIQWMSIKEACDFYRVSRRTIYYWINEAKVKTKRTPGGRYRIAVDLAYWEPEGIADRLMAQIEKGA